MKLTLTERDKKLLVVLAVVVLVAGLGFGCIQPLMNRKQELSLQVAEAEAEQLEKQKKIAELPVIAEQEEKVQENLSNLSENFYTLMRSVEIDKMLTEMALEKGVVVRELNITMPVEGTYTSITDYSAMLQQKQQAMGIGGSSTGGADTLAVYPGIYTVQIKLSLNGSSEGLWSLLDECAGLEPKLQVVDSLWQSQRSEENDNMTLSMNLNLYMAEDSEKYLQGELERQAAEAVTETETGTATEADLLE